jgi:protein tyrosine kinase modulator
MSDPTRPGSGFQRALEVWSRRQRLALLVLTVVLAGSLTFVWSLPGLYRSTATVLVDRKDVPQNFVTPSVTGELETRLETITQEILSRGRLEDLVKRFDLYPALRTRGSVEEAVEQMRKDIQREVKATEATGGRPATVAVLLSYRGPDPGTVAQVTNALASLYVEENATMRQRQASGTARFLASQVAEMKRKLEEQERRLGAAPRPVETDLAALERLNTRLRINSDRQLRDLDRRERLMKGLDATDTTGSVSVPGPESLPARLAKLKQELTALRTRFSDKYPDVIRVKSEIAAVERRLAEEPPEAGPERKGAGGSGATVGRTKDPIAEIDRELRTLKAEEQSLRQAIAENEQRAEKAPGRLQEYQQQARDYTALKEQYQVLAKRYEDAQMAESMEQRQKGEEFRILDPALPAKGPMAPSRLRLGLLSVVVSLGMAAGAVLLAERVDGSFHSIDELRAFSKVPVLAGIPRLVTEGDTLRRMRRRWLAMISLLVVLAVVTGSASFVARGNEGLVRMLAKTGGH